MGDRHVTDNEKRYTAFTECQSGTCIKPKKFENFNEAIIYLMQKLPEESTGFISSTFRSPNAFYRWEVNSTGQVTPLENFYGE